MHENLTRDGHEDLTAAASAINPEPRQAGIVFATAQQQITDLFVGDFAKSGEFSIRKYMPNPDGWVLVLDYLTRQLGMIAPVFRFLMDSSIQLAWPNRNGNRSTSWTRSSTWRSRSNISAS